MGDETAEEGASTTAPVMPESEAERSGEAEAHAGATDGPNADSAPIAGVGETNASTPEESVAEADQPEATEPEVDASEVVNPEVTDHGNSNPDTDAAAEETPPNEAQQTVDPGDQRCGVVALIGAPNVGKSTLVNQLVGAKVSIVTHKVQTTRARVRGVLTEDDTQIILVDTPGIFRPKRRLDRAMVDAAWAGADDADVVCFLVDAARGLDADGTRILERLDGTARPVVLILNKIDLIERSSLLALIAELAAKREFAATMLISALSGDGITDLRAYLADKMPSGPWLFPEDDLSDLPMRMLAAEITREKLFLRLHQELPYASTVETTEWKTLRDGSARIEQTIYVERPSQKQIVLGKSGRTIKAISSEARAELRDAIGSDVHLFLFVKVRENWGNDPERFREMGLEFPKL